MRSTMSRQLQQIQFGSRSLVCFICSLRFIYRFNLVPLLTSVSAPLLIYSTEGRKNGNSQKLCCIKYTGKAFAPVCVCGAQMPPPCDCSSSAYAVQLLMPRWRSIQWRDCWRYGRFQRTIRGMEIINLCIAHSTSSVDSHWHYNRTV